MPADGFPTSWRDPDYIAAIVGVIATGALFFYSALVESAPSTETIGFVLFWVLIPIAISYEIARRWL
ncbi:hypothetical protein [Halalkalicoccus subterraneus]|uniref:hypothetical protein n=1 Tax=Halalkalicoccus subterraneus TaxID=2675002 RepID=UPI000EFD9F5A|nr:hypothetical protein [Halalkalicoccus subterraneus]